MRFRNLRYVYLNDNKVYSIDTLYFSSEYLHHFLIESNELKIFNRFVFFNPNEVSINNLSINLGDNYLKRLPRFYGNISRINTITMLNQNGCMTVLGDYFFDNSAKFKVDNNVFLIDLTIKDPIQVYLLYFQ